MKVLCKYCGKTCEKERNVTKDWGRFACMKCKKIHDKFRNIKYLTKIK